MRGILPALGVALMEHFHWVIYPFAGLLFLSAVRLLREEAKTAAACFEIGPAGSHMSSSYPAAL
jgi:predicted tellurium resistance membrane protein TerC